MQTSPSVLLTIEVIGGISAIAVSLLPTALSMASVKANYEKSQDFNYFFAFAKVYGWQFLISLLFYSIVTVVDKIDKSNLQIAEQIGKFWIDDHFSFLNDASTSIASSHSLAHTVLLYYDIGITMTVFAVLFYFAIIGYESSAKAAEKKNDSSRFTAVFNSIMSFVFAIILIYTYSKITQIALFMPNDNSIIDRVKAFNTQMISIDVKPKTIDLTKEMKPLVYEKIELQEF